MITALLPLKDFLKAKQRLSGVLSPSERHAFFYAMVCDVLDVLTAQKAIDEIYLISDDPIAQSLAFQYQCQLLTEHELPYKGDLNRVMNAALEVLPKNDSTILAIHGDLPLLNVDDLDELIAQHCFDKPQLTIACDHLRRGSNILLFSNKLNFQFHYEENSLCKHKLLAKQLGIPVKDVFIEGVANDIDEPIDLLNMLNSHRSLSKKSMLFLKQNNLINRIQLMIDSMIASDASSQEYYD